MYAKGLYRDYIYVGYNNSRVFMYHIDLGTGKRKCNPLAGLTSLLMKNVLAFCYL